MFNISSVWFPYSIPKGDYSPLRVKSARGCYLELEDGNKLLDSMSSWWSVCHGYSHPYIISRMHEQIDKLPHVMLCSDLVHEGACELASRLAKLSPGCMEKVFFSDSGSMAVEVAMKIAVQCMHARREKEKSSFIFFSNAYHGDSMGCISVSNAIHNKSLYSYCPQQYLFSIPKNENDFVALSQDVKKLSSKVAGMILEPIVQCAGGMKIHSPDILRFLRELAKSNNILFIADEVATGFCRTGAMFACNHANVTPDIMVIGKAITGGMCPLSATLVSKEVCETFLSANEILTHGNTFMASPLACAAANASLDLFEEGKLLDRVSKIESKLGSALDKLRRMNCVHNLRVKGAIAAMEIDPERVERIKTDFLSKITSLGIWLRPLGNTVYLMPPLIVSDEELDKLASSIYALLEM